MAISSVGIGSGLGVENIVSQLVALEKAPLTSLKTKATSLQAQVSAIGELKSLFSDLTDVATKIADPAAWTARSASISSATSAAVSVTAEAAPTTFTLDVDSLAKQQSVSTATLAKGTTLSAGILKFQLGTWESNGAAFAPGTSSAVDIAVVAGDTLDTLASKINKAGIGVAAAVFNDGTNQRLLLSSKNTGAAAGFRIQASESGLQGFVFDPQASPSVGMAAAGVPVQYSADAKLRINGLPATSPTNTVSNAIAGVSIDLLAVTTTDYGLGTEVRKSASVTVSENVKSAVKNVQDLITAYNKINSALSDLVKYNAENKTAGLFQGDSTIVGLQSVLRGIVSSTSLGASAQFLADVGVERARDGSLSMNTNKLSTAANNGTLQKLFTNNNGNALTNGFALKLRDFGKGLIASGGAVANKTEALAGSLKKNTQDQTKVSDRATAVEARLRKQYTALDTKMASLNALNAYVSQQVTTWNKSTG